MREHQRSTKNVNDQAVASDQVVASDQAADDND